MFAYRVGFPGWKLAARLGFSLEVRFSLRSEKENGCLSAFSDDFSPYIILAAEGTTLEELVREVNAEIQEAMEIVFEQPPKEPIATIFIPDLASSS